MSSDTGELGSRPCFHTGIPSSATIAMGVQVRLRLRWKRKSAIRANDVAHPLSDMALESGKVLT